MTSGYKRLETALAHREPDFVPFDLGGTIVSGINVKALQCLVNFLGLSVDVKVQDQVTQMAELPEEVATLLKVDVKSTRPNKPALPGPSKDYGLVGLEVDGRHF